jgi:histidinol-phosphate phosphatase family protein
MSTKTTGVLGELPVPLALGLLRLGTEGRPPEADAIALVHEALDAGVRVLDTADTYCLDDKDRHYGERLARQAVSMWQGPQAEVRILTKVGMARPKGRWVPSGHPRQLKKAVDGSLLALGVERLFVLQLHARDPRVPFEETLAALALLQQEGKVEHLGLCNVSPAEVRQAQRHFTVALVQNELGVLGRKTATDGMIALTAELGIPLLAHRPLAGWSKVEKLDKNRVLGPIAKRHGRTPREVALALVAGAAPHVIPLVGATRPESLRSTLQTVTGPSRLVLTNDDRDAVEAKYSFAADPEALLAMAPRVVPPGLPTLLPGAGPSDSAEVVLVMGIQGAGKSELVRAYEKKGYARLNRDELGGALSDMVPALRDLLAAGKDRVVLDNTYPTRTSRGALIAVAHAVGVPVRCRWITTPVAEARINVVHRMLERHGALLGPVEFKEKAKEDPNLPPPVALLRFFESFEPPAMDEGFQAIDELPFVRRPAPSTWTNKGLLLDVDGTLRVTVSGEIYPRTADDVRLLPGRREVLLRWVEAGWRLFFVSNQSGIASGNVSKDDVDAAFARTRALLDLPIADVAYCPHPAFPVGCFCRKPMPGLAVDLMRRHQLDPKALVMVGDMDSDAAFADAIGARYHDAAAFFDNEERPPS